MNQRVRIALLGAGRMGALHGRNAAANPRLALAAVVDPRPEAAAAVARETGAEPVDFDTVLADPSIRGVVVASSTDRHLTDTLGALRAGKAVFCEKPLDLSAATLEPQAGELRAADARLFVAFNRRFDPHLRALDARLAAGEIGALESLHLISHDPAPPPPHFIPTSGGLFKDFTIHDFDTACWLLGEAPREIFAWASCLVDPEIGRAGDVDTARVVMKTAGGRLCVLANSRRSGYGYDQRVEAYGSQGAAFVQNPRVSELSRWNEDGEVLAPLPFGFQARYADAYRAEMDHFADILLGAAQPLTGYEASLQALKLAEAAALSSQTGAAVRL